MVLIIKYKHSTKEALVEWTYLDLNESLHNGSQISESSIKRHGYHRMGSSRLAINMSHGGEKDRYYSEIEKILKPTLRDKIISEIIGYG